MEQIYDPTPDEAVYQSVRDTLEIAEAQGDRAEYGKHLMEYLSERLTTEFGKGFTKRNLHRMKQFYLAFPIVHTLCAQLSWSHYRLVTRIEDPIRRDFYVRSAVKERSMHPA